MTTDGAAEPKSSPPGGTLGSVGPFQLIERLPTSRDVREFLARQRGPGGFERICVVKLASRTASDRRAAESLEREAKVMMRFDHPNIVRFHDFFEQDKDVVLVLEHFSNLTLARFLALMRERSLAIDERITWHLALSLFEALAHAHGLCDGGGEPAPIIHRDVRPDNVLLSSDGRIRLTGFSAAQDQVAKEEITALGAVVSVPSYVAPEQVRGSEATEGTDAYAAALIVWELLSGRSATPEGLSDFELLKRLSLREVEPLRALRPDLPALVTTALDLCLQRDPEERRIQCEEVAGCIGAGLDAGDGALALRQAISTLGPTVEKLAGGKSGTMPPSRRRLGSAPPLPHRPEAITLPEKVRISTRMEAAVTAVPIEPRPAPGTAAGMSSFDESTAVMMPIPPEPKGDEQSASEEDLEDLSDDLASVPPPPQPRPSPPPAPQAPASSPAPGFVASNAPARPEEAPFASDEDLDELKSIQRRRQAVRLAVIGVPVLITVVILLVALAGGIGGGTRDVSQPKASPPQPAVAASANDEVAKDDAVAPPGTASGAPVPAAPEPVPADQAALLVKGPPDGFVFVTGKSIGPTGERILTDCGQRFIRVGTRPGPDGLAGVRWLAEGQSVGLPCGRTTVVPAEPTRSAP